MDMLETIIALLRGKKPVGPQDQPSVTQAGSAAAVDPAYAAYAREARSMGETPVSPDEFARMNSGR